MVWRSEYQPGISWEHPYHSWVKHQHWFFMEDMQHLDVCLPEQHWKNFSRFRLGCSELRVNDHSVDRANRVCLLCGSRRVEDEMHIILECRYYDFLRSQSRWNTIFHIPDLCMKSFFSQKDQRTVAHFVTAVLTARKQGLLDRELADGYRGLDLFSSSDSDVWLTLGAFCLYGS